jgi:ferric-dicitrate binding protein FerR (iron transport regulator)
MKTIHDIDALIGKYLLGEASPEEAMLLEDWKAESHENEQYYLKSMAALGLVEHAFSTENAWQKVQPQLTETQAPIRTLFTRKFYQIAASIAVVLGVGGFAAYFFTQISGQQLFAAKDVSSKVILKDGTQVTIAKNSSIELKDGYGTSHRYLKLKGSGYFSVKHSDQMPFVIDAGPLHIKDLGTKFDVNASGDTIFVRVDEGVVMIYDNVGMKITLKATQSAYYVISTGEMEFEVETNAPNGQGKTFVFDNQRLETVIARLNQVYQTDIRIETPAVKNCLITTQFTDEELDMVLSVIAETLGLTVEKQGSVYWLKGTSCE